MLLKVSELFLTTNARRYSFYVDEKKKSYLHCEIYDKLVCKKFKDLITV